METDKPKKNYQTTEGRRAYQRAYYLAHKEKAREYSRIYNRNHKKSKGVRPVGETNLTYGDRYANVFALQREAYKTALTPHDLMESDAIKTEKLIKDLISGKRILVA